MGDPWKIPIVAMSVDPRVLVPLMLQKSGVPPPPVESRGKKAGDIITY